MGVEVKRLTLHNFHQSTFHSTIWFPSFFLSFFLFLSSFYFFLLVVAPSEYLFWIVTRPSVTWNWFDSCISAFCHDHLNVMHVPTVQCWLTGMKTELWYRPWEKRETRWEGKKKWDWEWGWGWWKSSRKQCCSITLKLSQDSASCCVQPSQKQLLKVEGFHKQSDEREHSRKKKEDEKGRERERDGKE